jgi:hypothetical protein
VGERLAQRGHHRRLHKARVAKARQPPQIGLLPVLFAMLWRRELTTDLTGSVLGAHSRVQTSPARSL